jgi:hypothetical protein
VRKKRKRKDRPRTVTAEVTMSVTGAITAPVALPAGDGPRDLLNRPVDPLHRDLLDLYLRTKALCARDDLPPYAARNLRKSLACLYQAVNDGGVVFEHLYDLGV